MTLGDQFVRGPELWNCLENSVITYTEPLTGVKVASGNVTHFSPWPCFTDPELYTIKSILFNQILVLLDTRSLGQWSTLGPCPPGRLGAKGTIAVIHVCKISLSPDALFWSVESFGKMIFFAHWSQRICCTEVKVKRTTLSSRVLFDTGAILHATSCKLLLLRSRWACIDAWVICRKYNAAQHCQRPYNH